MCACALTPRPEDHAPVAPRACPPLRSCRGPAVTPISAQVLIPACRDGHSAATPLSCHLGILPPCIVHGSVHRPLPFVLPPPLPVTHPSGRAHRYSGAPWSLWALYRALLRCARLWLRVFFSNTPLSCDAPLSCPCSWYKPSLYILHCCGAGGYGLEFFFKHPIIMRCSLYRACLRA